MLRVLETEQEKRDDRERLIDGEFEWITLEREAMFRAVNEERQRLNLKPITLDLIRRAEDSACGHCDYTHKFALYCAELATDRLDFNA